MKSVLFADLTCPTPYDSETLETVPQGGTESSVTRIAEALAVAGYTVQVAQHNRTEAGKGFAEYLPFDACEREQDTVVALRTPAMLPYLRETFKPKKLYLHCHDFNVNEIVRNAEVIASTKTEILCVSNTHRSVFVDALLTQCSNVRGLKVRYVYNPIPDTLVRDETPTLHRKLVFFSSPHKGLENTLRVFGHLKRNIPMLTLYVANPGYLEGKTPSLPGVVWLGKLSHPEVIKHVREAFAVFHMNDVFPETFGLVHAEALAVGTPVLTSSLGATPEVLGQGPHSDMLIDVKDEKAVLERIERWMRDGRPSVELKPELRLSAVLKAWEGLINE